MKEPLTLRAKNIFTFFVVLTFSIFLLTFSASAHPGRTDSKGGHTSSSTGEYHYHHGYDAHQHPNGTCPYEFDDQTRRSSGSQSPETNEADINKGKDSNDQPETISFWKKILRWFERAIPITVAGITGIYLLYTLFGSLYIFIKDLFKRK